MCRADFRLMMILYAVVCFMWIPLNLWMMPWHSLHIGQVSNHPRCLLPHNPPPWEHNDMQSF